MVRVIGNPRHFTSGGLAVLAASVAFVSLIDPRVSGLGPVAVGAALFMWGLAARARQPTVVPAAVVLLTSCFVVIGWSGPRWCCDAQPYYMYLRSAAFDHDLDFMNEWIAFGIAPELAATGRAINFHSVGPAILWAPFVFAAHLYVIATRALGLGSYAPDGYSSPYLLATAAGTGTAVVVGIFALWRTCCVRFSSGAATVAVGLGLLTSTLPYYLFVVPSVAHGPVFAASAVFLAVWVKVEGNPSLRGWISLAVLLGIVSLFRWQTVVLGLMFVPLFADAWRRRIGRWWWPLACVFTSALVFSPQAGAWWVIFGSPLAVPSQAHGMDWSSPHFVDVLFSADRGLFTWTPAMALGCLGWVFLSRRWAAFAWSAWAIFFATTWVNGGVAIWSGADAFGARRFDLLIPLWTVGLAAGIQASILFLQRRPVLAPAAVLGLLALWNMGLMRLYNNGVFADAAPLEELAARQAAALRHTSEDWLSRLAGERGRNFAYMFFVGRYFYLNTGFDGRIDLTLPVVPYLAGNWSARIERPDFGPFRFAGREGACLKVPFEKAFDLRVVVSARSMSEAQRMSLVVNGERVGEADLPMDWTDTPFVAPAAVLRPGENILCVTFSQARRNGRAAAVRRFQLP